MNISSNNNQEENYDSARIAKVAAATLKASIEQTRGLPEFARQNNWPGFSDSDRRIISDVVGMYRENKQRVAQKIGELKASISDLALTLLMPVESDEILERRKLVVEYLQLILDPVHLEGLATQFNMQMTDEHTSNADLKQYIEETRAYRTHGFLEAFDTQIGEENMEMTRVVLERFGTGIDGIRGARKLAAGSIDGAIGSAEEFSYSGGGNFRLPGGLTPIEDIINE